MKAKIKEVLIILFFALACIALGAQIITDCQKQSYKTAFQKL